MTQTIQDIATALMSPNKGILAADESARTMQKRFAPINLPQTTENNRRYRNLLFTAPGIEEYLSGIILYDETIHQSADDGTPFPALLASRGIIPGIKVDEGLVQFGESDTEQISLGFDGLDKRLNQYYEIGARFTKWRSVIRIGEDFPTQEAVDANVDVLAKYALQVQAHNMVPIVEPEVLFEGTHTLERSAEVLRHTLRSMFEVFRDQGVVSSGLILKTSMALPGKESGIPLDPGAIAGETVGALQATLPDDLAGVVFLSGGQTPEQATLNLNAIAEKGAQSWPLTFSYSRAIEEPVLAAWGGEDANVPAAQAALLERLQANVAARNGTYEAH
jgi:fructose-bisphosphate aldolase class I